MEFKCYIKQQVGVAASGGAANTTRGWRPTPRQRCGVWFETTQAILQILILNLEVRRLFAPGRAICFREKHRPAQSLKPPWGRTSRLYQCSGSDATEQDLLKTVISTTQAILATT